MLLLGAVALFEPVNGYQIRRELPSWQVERWAHVDPGWQMDSDRGKCRALLGR